MRRFSSIHAAGSIATASLVLGMVTMTTPPAQAGTAQLPAVSVASQPVQYVKVDGATLGYRIAGAGTPLVLIAGSSNTMAEWDPRLLDALARQHRVLIFDNRGAGTSTGSVDHLTIALMAGDTEQLIAQVVQGSAHVLGWSMGGYIAQVLAIDFPDRVRRLVLASTDCGGSQTVPPKPWALEILTNPGATQDQRMSVLFPKNRLGAGAAWSSAIGAAYAANGYQPDNAFTMSPATAEAQTLAAGHQWLNRGGGTCARLGRITQQVLIGAGRDDVIVPVRNHLALLQGIPRAQARVYPDAGHAFLFQPALQFARAVNAFLS